MLAFSSTLLQGRLQGVVVSEKGRSGPSSYFIMLQLNVACKLKLGLLARLPPRDSGSRQISVTEVLVLTHGRRALSWGSGWLSVRLATPNNSMKRSENRPPATSTSGETVIQTNDNSGKSRFLVTASSATK